MLLDLNLDNAHITPTVLVARHDGTQAFVVKLFTIAFVRDHCWLSAKIRRDLASRDNDHVAVTTSDADGFARIVVTGDKAGGRFVSNIAKIEIRGAGK